MSNLSESSRSSSAESILNEDPSPEVKFTINIVLNNFHLANNNKELELPSSLTRFERAYVHKLCEQNGLISTTRGKGAKKCVHITKKSDDRSIRTNVVLKLPDELRKLLTENQNLLTLSQREREELIAKIQKPYQNQLHSFYKNISSLGLVQPNVPKISVNSNPTSYPIDLYKQDILKLINLNRFLFIGGEAGLGKTNQIGQYILEFYHVICQKCRVIFSCPHDLQAILSAYKISKQRHEILGDTVGYHVTSNKISNENTCLTFCTHEILLKNLMSPNDVSFFNSITHIVLDDVHYVDRYLEFMLILIKDLAFKFKHLKFILIGSPQVGEQIQKYFVQCNILVVPSSPSFQEFFLEEVLEMTKFKWGNDPRKDSLSQLEKWCVEKRKKSFFKKCSNQNMIQTNRVIDVNFLIEKSFTDGVYFNELLSLIQTNAMQVDYQHSQTMITCLMSASVNGLVDVVESLLKLGSNPNLKSVNDLTAIDWAKRFAKNEILNLLESYQQCEYYGNLSLNEYKYEKEMNQNETFKMNDENFVLKSYYQKSSERSWFIDFELLFKLVKRVIETVLDGSILIYFSNYDEICKFYDILSADKTIKLKIFRVFKEMNHKELIKVYDEPERKIILSTQLSEYLSTFENIKTVIDTGVTEERLNDDQTNSNLKKCVWISKQCSLNRCYKASKSIQIYHIYSKSKFKNLPNQKSSEFITYPLQEICLLSKLVIPFNTSITDLISRGLEFPAFLQLRNSINCLKSIDALDTWEDMTDLGVHLTNLNIDLKLAKSILYSIVLKCLDPVLVIVSILTIGDIFNKETGSDKLEKSLADESFSDHVVLYKVFKLWKASIKENSEHDFCIKHKLNRNILYQVESLRIKLLMHLRDVNFVKCYGSGDLNDINKNSNNSNCVKASLVAGLYPNILRYDKKSKSFTNDKEGNIKISINSNLWSDPQTDWAFYDNTWCLTGTVQFIKRISFISLKTLAILTGPLRLNDSNVNSTLKIDNFINIEMDKNELDLVLSLRKKFSSMFIKFLKSQSLCQEDNELIDLVVQYLGQNDISLQPDIQNIDFTFNFRLKNFHKNEVFFVSEVGDISQKLINNNFKLGLMLSSDKQKIFDYLKSNKKLFVLFKSLTTCEWKGCAELFLTPIFKDTPLSIFEFNDTNLIYGVKILNLKNIPFTLTNEFVKPIDLNDSQELDGTIGKMVLDLMI